MNNIKYLPLGSLVILKGGTKKLLIFGRKQVDSKNNKKYDYVGVTYPEGNIGKENTYLFNHRDIKDIVFLGFTDHEDESFQEYLSKINDWVNK